VWPESWWVASIRNFGYYRENNSPGAIDQTLIPILPQGIEKQLNVIIVAAEALDNKSMSLWMFSGREAIFIAVRIEEIIYHNQSGPRRTSVIAFLRP